MHGLQNSTYNFLPKEGSTTIANSSLLSKFMLAVVWPWPTVLIMEMKGEGKFLVSNIPWRLWSSAKKKILQYKGEDPGGGVWGPMPPLPSGLSKCNHGRFTTRLVHVATLTQHCFISCKCKVFKTAAPKRQFCGSTSNTKADSKGRGLRETTVRWIAWVRLQWP